MTLLSIHTSLKIFKTVKSTVLKCKDYRMLKTKATNQVALNLNNTSSSGCKIIRKNKIL